MPEGSLYRRPGGTFLYPGECLYERIERNCIHALKGTYLDALRGVFIEALKEVFTDVLEVMFMDT